MSFTGRILACTAVSVLFGAALLSGTAQASEGPNFDNEPARGPVLSTTDNLNWDSTPACVAAHVAAWLSAAVDLPNRAG
jgi:hypothetical protein